MICSVKNCISEDFTRTFFYINAAYSLNLSESTFTRCKVSGNGGVINAVGSYQNLIINKVCSEGCTATGDGQFLYSALQSNYDVNVTFSIFFNSQSSGRFGLEVFARKFEIGNTNFSFLKANLDPAFGSDQTRNGFLISYSQISNNTDPYHILSLQEVDSSSDKNIMKFVNVLYNNGKSIVYINSNKVTHLLECNFHFNDGSNYLICLVSAVCYINKCSVQETFGGSKDKICNGNNVINSESTIIIIVDAPQKGDCGAILNVCSNMHVNHFRKLLSIACVSCAPLILPAAERLPM